MTIASITPAHVASIIAQDGGNGWNRDERHWSEVLRQVEMGRRVTLIATHEGQVVGYGSLLWRSSSPASPLPAFPRCMILRLMHITASGALRPA